MSAFRFQPLYPALTALIISAAPLWAEESPAKPTVTADREAAVYQTGEEITFTIQTPEKPATRYGRLEWTATLNDATRLKSGDQRLKQGETTVTITPDQPGFIRFTVAVNPDTRLTKPKKQTAVTAVAVAPEELKPGSPAPDDFDEYWKIQKEALAGVPANAEMTPVPSSDERIALFDVKVDSLGKPVSGYYARPDGAAEKSLPAILFLHSAGVRGANQSLVTTWAKRNMLALDINAHGIANGQPKEFYDELKDGELRNYQFEGRDSRDNYYFNGVYLRIIRAIDFLTSQPEWDGRTLITYGSSQGGAQAIVAAGLDSRVTFYAGFVPALCDLSGDLAGRAQGWPRGLIPPKGGQETVVREVVRYYDVANFAQRIKVPGIISLGFLDATCPPSSVYAAYNVIPAEKTILHDVNAAHAATPESAKTVGEKIAEHLNR